MADIYKYNRRHFLNSSVMALAAVELGMFGFCNSHSCGTGPEEPATFKNELSSLKHAEVWFNTQPLTATGLQGKVVLINFWTYTCINWLRQLPYVRAWAEKYKEQGLVVIGIHTPEFEFEKNADNVQRAIKDMNIGYPVGLDGKKVIWDAFDNNYWPALYFIDAKGRIRHQQFGEGEYEKSERFIQQLLEQSGNEINNKELVSVLPQGAEAAADWNNLLSGENYTGYIRTENFASPGGKILSKLRTYEPPAKLMLNQWAVAGDWTMEKEKIVMTKPGGRIVYRFHSRDLHVVMGPSVQGASIRFRVHIDGQAPGDGHGTDVDKEGNGRVVEQRLYQLIRQTGPIIDRQFEIEFFDSGVEGFAFTFG